MKSERDIESGEKAMREVFHPDMLGIEVTLKNAPLWKQFHGEGTEMIITKSGRTFWGKTSAECGVKPLVRRLVTPSGCEIGDENDILVALCEGNLDGLGGASYCRRYDPFEQGITEFSAFWPNNRKKVPELMAFPKTDPLK